eukprot:16473_1
MTELLNDGFTFEHSQQAIELSKSSINQESHKLTILISMGFNADMAATALQRCHGDVNAAVEYMSTYKNSFSYKLMNGMFSSVITKIEDPHRCQFEQILECKYNNNKINKCQHLQQFIKSLQIFESLIKIKQHDNEHNIDEIKIKLPALYDNFCHLLLHHDNNHAFETIYNELGGRCDEKCIHFRRNYRNRDKISIDMYSTDEYKAAAEIIAMHQIIDSVHCFYRHSFDIGYRLSIKERESIENCVSDQKEVVDTDNEYFKNHQIIRTYEILANKRKKLSFISNRLSGKKYNQLNVVHSKYNEYKFGKIFNYGHNYPSGASLPTEQMHVSPKYTNLKQEMLLNAIFAMKRDQYDQEYNKAQTKFNSKRKRENPNLRVVSLKHFLALMIYSNYDALQYTFSRTYYIEEEIKLHDNFFHLGWIIRDCLALSGTPIYKGKIKHFYHGMGEKLIFPRVIGDGAHGVCINAPLSTSWCQLVAMNIFTNQNKGLVVTFGGGQYGGSSYFSLDWLSDFVNEKECLFAQTNNPLEIVDILCPATGMEMQSILKLLRIINKIFHSGYIHETLDNNQCDVISKIIDNQLSYKFPEQYEAFKTLDGYAKELIHVYFKNKYRVEIELKKAKKFVLDKFKRTDYPWVRLDLIQALFENHQILSVCKVPLNDQIFQDVFCHLIENTDIKLKSIDMERPNCSDENA